MKIEKINENQIKCTLNRSDLASRQLKLSELAYGTEKAKGLFQDMMEQANLEFGFDASDIPLMIEAIPVSMDCIILMITKVEDPDEVDMRLSSLSNLKELFSPAGPFDEPFDGPEAEDGPVGPPFPFGELTEKFQQKQLNASERLFSFRSLESVIDLAHHVSSIFEGTSSLYKSPEEGTFHLYLTAASPDMDHFTRVCRIASEFGTAANANFARKAYMDEHFEQILADRALQELAKI